MVTYQRFNCAAITAWCIASRMAAFPGMLFAFCDRCFLRERDIKEEQSRDGERSDWNDCVGFQMTKGKRKKENSRKFRIEMEARNRIGTTTDILI